MKFYETSEVSGEGRLFIRSFVLLAEEKINLELSTLSTISDLSEWDFYFISIIMQDSDYFEGDIDKYYKEIRRRSLKNKEFEFRVRIPYSQLEHGDLQLRIKLYFSALKNCFNNDLIKKWKICIDDLNKIYTVFEKVEKDLINKFS